MRVPIFVHRMPLLRTLFLLFLFLLTATQVHAQRPRKASGFDTAYVHDYSHIVTGRFYLITKYNRMRFGANGAPDLVYQPNNRYNFGLGVSYRSLTLNIGVGIPGINVDQHKYGATKYLDAQANVYTKRWATNLFLQRFAGYYTPSYSKDELGWVQDTELATRGDLVQWNIGASTVKILNNDRFSYRAAFNQDAWQRKSQGSWLVGGYLTYFALQADSSLVPQALADRFEDGLHMRKGRFWDIGPMGGYAYTWVYRDHWFVTGSGVVGAGLSAQRVETKEPDEQTRTSTVTGPGWHLQVRAGAGYNSRNHYFGMSWTQENILYLVDARDRFSWTVGNVRVNFVKRFNRRLDRMDRGMRWFRKKVREPVEEMLPLPK